MPPVAEFAACGAAEATTKAKRARNFLNAIPTFRAEAKLAGACLFSTGPPFAREGGFPAA